MSTTGRIDEAGAVDAIDQAIDPFFALDAITDADGRITDFRYVYVNPAGLRLYQRPADEVVGRTLVELFPSVEPLGILDCYAEVARSGQPAQFTIPTFQVGEAASSLEITVEASAGGVAIWVSDQTSRTMAELELARSRARFDALVERSGDVLLVIDAAGFLEYASPALEHVLGYAPAEVLGRSAFDFVHPDDVPIAAESMARLLGEPGVAQPVTYRVRTVDGSFRWMEDIASNLLDDPLVNGIVLTLRDITAHRETASELALANRVLRTVTEADAAVVRATSEAELLADMCRVVVETGGYPMAWVAARDPACPGRAVPMATVGDAQRFIDQVLSRSPGPVAQGPAVEALRSGRTVCVPDLAALPAGLPIREVSLAAGFRSQLALPLVVQGEVTYALSIHAAEVDAFDIDEIALFEQLAENLAFGLTSLRTAIERQRYLDQVTQSFDALVGTLTAVVEQRDPYTSGHQDRVAQIAVEIARQLGIGEDEVAGISMAARLHDIGKVAIPAEILTKPGRLSSTEMELVRHHAQVGHDLLKDLDLPWPVARMILEHHERLDGSGYPQGLVGEEIHLGSRIIAVADVVEAMTTHRPYRPGKGVEAALAQIAEERGTRLDADVVDACTWIVRAGRVDLT